LKTYTINEILGFKEENMTISCFPYSTPLSDISRFCQEPPAILPGWVLSSTTLNVFAKVEVALNGFDGFLLESLISNLVM
jgi:hypothetical protein